MLTIQCNWRWGRQQQALGVVALLLVSGWVAIYAAPNSLANRVPEVEKDRSARQIVEAYGKMKLRNVSLTRNEKLEMTVPRTGSTPGGGATPGAFSSKSNGEIVCPVTQRGAAVGHAHASNASGQNRQRFGFVTTASNDSKHRQQVGSISTISYIRRQRQISCCPAKCQAGRDRATHLQPERAYRRR